MTARTISDGATAGSRVALSGAAEAEREETLVRRVREGDTGAFDALVARYIRQARAVALRLMRNREDADDLVQDAFLRALERIDRFDPGRAFGPWFLRLLTNAGLDTLRRGRVRQDEEEARRPPREAPVRISTWNRWRSAPGSKRRWPTCRRGSD